MSPRVAPILVRVPVIGAALVVIAQTGHTDTLSTTLLFGGAAITYLVADFLADTPNG